MIRRLDDTFTPDGDEARRWAEQELSDARYAEATPTWFDYAARDIGRFLSDLFTPEGGGDVAPVALIVVCVIVVAALIVALLVWGKPRRARAVRTPHGALLGATDDRSAAQLRSDAERAAKTGDWDEATILRFRALARGLLERDLLDPSPGATAQAIAREIAQVFPSETQAVRRAAAAFDDVRYLRRPATEQGYADIAHTDERIVLLRLEPAVNA